VGEMFRIIFSFVLLLTATGQLSKDAKILKEQRFNDGDGSFGSAFAQEDGTVYREETTADGERIGQYSYVDNDGQTITVKYTAGIDGFRILEGAHVPKGATGLNSAPFDPKIAANDIQKEPNQPESTPPRKSPRQPIQPIQPVSTPRRKAIRRRLPINQQKVSRQSQVSQNNPAPRLRQPLPVTPSKPQETSFNPFINPADPTHLDLKFNTNAAQFAGYKQSGQTRGQSQPRQQASFPSAASVPNCADCGGVNPFINPADFSHQEMFRQQNIANSQSARQPVPQSFQSDQQSFQPVQQSFQPAQQSFQPAQQSFQPAKQSFQPAQQSFQPAQQSFQTPQQSFQSSQQSFQPAQQSFKSSQQSFQLSQPNLQSAQQGFRTSQQPFQPTQQTFQSAQQSFQPPQQNFQSVKQSFQAPQQTFQSPRQSQQETILPAFLEQPSQRTQQFSPQQQFQQPLQFQANSAQNTDFQGQLSLNRFQSGFNFDFSA